MSSCKAVDDEILFWESILGDRPMPPIMYAVVQRGAWLILHVRVLGHWSLDDDYLDVRTLDGSDTFQVWEGDVFKDLLDAQRGAALLALAGDE
jgi:hypothetical protein